MPMEQQGAAKVDAVVGGEDGQVAARVSVEGSFQLPVLVVLLDVSRPHLAEDVLVLVVDLNQILHLVLHVAA